MTRCGTLPADASERETYLQSKVKVKRKYLTKEETEAQGKVYHRGGRHYGSFDVGEFIAWDGEGCSIEGVHSYMLLRSSASEEYVSCIDKGGLSTRECFEFIMRVASENDRRSIHVMYGASYDVNMMLRDLSPLLIYKLWKNGKCVWYDDTRQPWKIEYRPRKYLRLWKLKRWGYYTYNPVKKKRQWNVEAFVTLWDVIGFFQCSFVNAMKDYLKEYDSELMNVIVKHKNERSVFSVNEFDDINYYCSLECDALVQIMSAVRSAMIGASIKVKRWDGAGAIAEAFMSKFKVKQHMKQSSDEIRDNAWRAYGGGRIEAIHYGHYVGKVHHYDINSAYPTVIEKLPSLAGKEWCEAMKHEYKSASDFSLWYVTWNYTSDSKALRSIYPFFYRDSKGKITYPPYGSGVRWKCEIEAALSVPGMSKHVTVLFGWKLKGSDSVSAFEFVGDLYEQRQQMKSSGDAAQMILKLGLNSMYGKMAQQVGGKTIHDKDSGELKVIPPTFQQVEYAGYITAYTRASLYRVAIKHAESIIMFATDSVFSTVPLDVPIGKGLGEWEYHCHDEVIVVQSGVYWYRDGDKWTSHFRGFDKDQLNKDAILEAWSRGETSVTTTSERFMTMGAALASVEEFAKWRTWSEVKRDMKLTARGTKRTEMFPNGEPPVSWKPHTSLVQTRATVCFDLTLGLESQPYKVDPELVERRARYEEVMDNE